VPCDPSLYRNTGLYRDHKLYECANEVNLVQHNTDALIRATLTKVHTADAFIVNRYFKTHTTDAYLIEDSNERLATQLVVEYIASVPIPITDISQEVVEYIGTIFYHGWDIVHIPGAP